MVLVNELATSRVVLRPLCEADVSDSYVQWLNDPRVNRFLESRFHRHTLASCVEFVQRCNSSAEDHLFGIFLKDEGVHVGNVKLGFVSQIHSRGEIGIMIGEQRAWGKGYGKEAIYALTRYAFESVALRRVEAGCAELNVASRNAFLAVGFRVEGLLRSHWVDVDGQRIGCLRMGALPGELREPW